MLYPLFGMVALTFILLFMALAARINAVRSGELTPDSFRLNPTAGAPETVVKTTRHFSNLFEMPVLFYLACVLCLILDLRSQILVSLAWMYVLARVIHALIHVTYNNVTHRLIAFAFSNLALIGIWGAIVESSI